MTTTPSAVAHGRKQLLQSPMWSIGGLGILALVIGALTARQLATGQTVVALSVVGYVALLAAVWWWSRGNAPIVVIVAYLIGPAPADNILTQVFIFPSTDYSLRSRDLFFLADIVLIAALLWVRPSWPGARLLRWWLAGLGVLAVYPVVVGALAGPGQSFIALAQGATMPLRAIGLVWLISGWARSRGWDETLRAVARSVICCALVLAGAVLLAIIAAHGQSRLTVLNYPLVVDGRPALPGWGNNILANFFCVCAAIVVFGRRWLAWRLRVLVVVSAVLLLGLLFTEVRIAMLLALLIVEAPIVLAVLRRVWPRRGALPALAAAGASALLLGLITVTVLPAINPRFQTLTPAFIAHQVASSSSGNSDDSDTVSDADTGVDLGGQSFGTRSGLVLTAARVWGRDPILGVGWNGWGWAKNEESSHLTIAIDPHNGLIWLLAETGIVGLFLLYGAPLVAMWRSWRRWALWMIPLVATVLELLNPNLRDGHFAVIVWAFLAMAIIGDHRASDEPRYTIRSWLRDSGQWLRGASSAALPSAAMTEEQLRGGVDTATLAAASSTSPAVSPAAPSTTS